jgi:hypothetical protein
VSLPAFTATTKLTDSPATSASTIVRAFNALVTNLQQIFTSLLQQVQLNSVLLANVELTTGSNIVPHTLGRTLTGWKVTRQNAAASIYDAQATNDAPQTYLVLVASAPCTVSLEVF